jgi:hypothetical protein
VPIEAPVPVEAPPTPRRAVVEREPTNRATTIFASALVGGLAGVLVGGAMYFLVDDRNYADRIPLWAAGGLVVGAGVGLTQVFVQESRSGSAMASLPSDPAPTFRLSLLRARF